MKLNDVATIRTNFPDADFWLVRRGSLKTCGQPTRQFHPEHIGIRVERTDILLSSYLYYCLENLHMQGRWEGLAKGSLALVNIRISDVKSIGLEPR